MSKMPGQSQIICVFLDLPLFLLIACVIGDCHNLDWMKYYFYLPPDLNLLHECMYWYISSTEFEKIPDSIGKMVIGNVSNSNLICILIITYNWTS